MEEGPPPPRVREPQTRAAVAAAANTSGASSHPVPGATRFLWAPTGIQDLDDGVGLVDVQLQALKPAVVHQVEEDVEPVLESVLGLLLPPSGFFWVVLGPEPERGPSEEGREWKQTEEGRGRHTLAGEEQSMLPLGHRPHMQS